MFQQIGNLLIESVFGFFIFLLLLRFYMQAFRAPFRNPAGELVTTLTGWMVRPIRRFIPGLYGVDLSCMVLAWFLETIMLALLRMLTGATTTGAAVLKVSLIAIVDLARLSMYLLIGVIFVQVILSWVSPYNPISGVLDALTRPFYAFFRRFIPTIGNIDLSPIFILLGAQIAIIVLNGLMQSVATAF
ncbi:MAG: YggT family protein [Burkholderiales bacterium]